MNDQKMNSNSNNNSNSNYNSTYSNTYSNTLTSPSASTSAPSSSSHTLNNNNNNNNNSSSSGSGSSGNKLNTTVVSKYGYSTDSIKASPSSSTMLGGRHTTNTSDTIGTNARTYIALMKNLMFTFCHDSLVFV